MSDIKTSVLGFPRLGEKRELKVALESFWKGRMTKEELLQKGKELRKRHWLLQREAGADIVPTNDFSFYDQVLDMSCLLGNVPERYGCQEGDVTMDAYFSMARGDDKNPALEMTKWFDTNYHYLVPEFHHGTEFRVASGKVFEEFLEARELGLEARPVLIGPMTYLALGKEKGEGFSRFSLLGKVLAVYAQVLRRLGELGAEWVQLDEPLLATNLDPKTKVLFRRAYQELGRAVPGVKIMVASYYGPLKDNLETLTSLPVAAYHLDLVADEKEVERLVNAVPINKTLSLGVINGRNVWRADLLEVRRKVELVRQRFSDRQLQLSTSCSLLHCPFSLLGERSLTPGLRSVLSFSLEKVRELRTLRDVLAGTQAGPSLEASHEAIKTFQESLGVKLPEVRERAEALCPGDRQRASAFSVRQKKQQKTLRLPLFPTTTIGSFPQTAELRRVRARWRKGELSEESYQKFLKEQIRECVQWQEEVGLDVLVHGEAERTDMVEYFGEQLQGFAFTQNGWVQSYGSRGVKPPIIYGDVSRRGAMTVREASFAQSLTERPVKGMLTGPVTILHWSFVREDQPRSKTAEQIGLAIREEVLDLEDAGIRVIQIDEPALREGLPLRKEDHSHYLKWAVDAFRLASAGVKDQTQIHTHMCYSEFRGIIASIGELDADVITIETSRSEMKLLEVFKNYAYPNEIGPGVYDIHSPRIPNTEEMVDLLEKAGSVLPIQNLWVNPDCGLKTRGWAEVRPALEAMVKAAEILRARFTEDSGKTKRVLMVH